jgi:hypothetical protein
MLDRSNKNLLLLLTWIFYEGEGKDLRSITESFFIF